MYNVNPKSRDALVLAIKSAIIGTGFTDSDWKDLGYKTGAREYIANHPRLLRSLSWGDPDYEGHVLDTIEHILNIDPDNLQVLLSEEAIKRWFATNDPRLYSEFAAEPITTAVARPKPAITSDLVERAINDAESLIRSSGATSGVDRIHTALDGYLRVVCDEGGITYGKDPNITYLFAQLRQHHSAFQDLGPRPQDITQIVRALSSVLDVINPLRNKASMAHPNQQLLDEAEAMLVINSARTILHYVDSKLTHHKRSGGY